MSHKFSAGKFEATAWEGGYPVWCQVRVDNQEVISGIHHRELKDLIYALQRLHNALHNERMLAGHETELD